MDKGKLSNKITILVFLAGCIGIMIICFAFGYGRRELAWLPPLFLLIPFIIEKIFRLKPYYLLNNILYIFIFFAFAIGTVMEVYKAVPFYDKAVHFASGILFPFIGTYVYELLTSRYGKEVNPPLDVKGKAVYISFSVFFSLAIGYVWELYEYIFDLITGDDVQWVELTGINDTMQDMLSHFIGTVLFIALIIIRLRGMDKRQKV